MGILGDIGKVIIGGILGGPAGAILVFSFEHGDEVVEATIDVARKIVKIGADVYREIPPEAFLLVGNPIPTLLKHVEEDEIILLGELAGNIAIMGGLTWPAQGPIEATLTIAKGAIPSYVAVGTLIGKLDRRPMNDQEWEMAHSSQGKFPSAARRLAPWLLLRLWV